MSRFASVWQYLMYLFIAWFVGAFYLLAVMAVTKGWDFVLAGGVALVSLVAMWVIRLLVEQESTEGMFSLRTQSWAFVIGDGLVLPFVMLALTRGWQELDPNSAYLDWDWFFMALTVGVLGAIMFRMMDAKRYIWAGRESSLYSPTKVWHDFAVVPLLLSVVMWTAVPQMVEAWSVHTSFAAVALAGYVALVLRDHVIGVDVDQQHYEWNVRTFEVA